MIIFRAIGGYVAVPSNDEENKQFVNMAANYETTTVWIGLSVTKNAATIAGKLNWTDGSSLLNGPYKTPWSYTNLEATMYAPILGTPRRAAMMSLVDFFAEIS